MEFKNIPLKELMRTKKNVRTVQGEPEELEELKASIMAHGGVFQNLVVLPANKSGRYGVIAGDRRLQACQSLLKEERIPDTFVIPCEVLGDDEIGIDPAEISLAENITHVPLHPADQYVAFARVYKGGKGLSVEQIGDRFGVTARVVEQRLRLGMLHPDLIENYRQGAIRLETLMSFTLAGDDQERQMEVAKAIAKANNGRVESYYVEQYLTGKKATGNDRLVRFVGLDAYHEAGGTVTRDLFADEDSSGIYIDNMDLLNKLALEKMEPEAEKRRAQGWKWVEVCLEGSWERTRAHDRLEPARGTRHNKLEMSMSGVILSVAYNGEVEAERGLVKKEDRKEVQAYIRQVKKEAEEVAQKIEESRVEGQGSEGEAEGDTGNGAAPDAPATPEYNYSSTSDSSPDPVKEAIKKAGLTQALTDDLQVLRMNCARWTLTQYAVHAHDMLIFSLAVSLFGSNYNDGEIPLDMVARTPRTDPPNVDLEPDAARTLFEKQVQTIKEKHCRWILGIEEWDGKMFVGRPKVKARDRWLAFCELEAQEKEHIQTVCVAMMMHNQTGICHRAEETLEQILLEISPPWSMFRPTRDNYFNRLSKANLLDLLDQLCSDKDPDRIAIAKQLKKGELAEMLGKMFADPKAKTLNLHKATQRRVAEWYPPSFSPKKLRP